MKASCLLPKCNTLPYKLRCERSVIVSTLGLLYARLTDCTVLLHRTEANFAHFLFFVFEARQGPTSTLVYTR